MKMKNHSISVLESVWVRSFQKLLKERHSKTNQHTNASNMTWVVETRNNKNSTKKKKQLILTGLIRVCILEEASWKKKGDLRVERIVCALLYLVYHTPLQSCKRSFEQTHKQQRESNKGSRGSSIPYYLLYQLPCLARSLNTVVA